MERISRPVKCKHCGKTIQFLFCGNQWRPVSPSMIRFTRCENALSKFYDRDGKLVRGYRSEDGKGEPGYQPHDQSTSCFVFPFER